MRYVLEVSGLIRLCLELWRAVIPRVIVRTTVRGWKSPRGDQDAAPYIIHA